MQNARTEHTNAKTKCNAQGKKKPFKKTAIFAIPVYYISSFFICILIFFGSTIITVSESGSDNVKKPLFCNNQAIPINELINRRENSPASFSHKEKGNISERWRCCTVNHIMTRENCQLVRRCSSERFLPQNIHTLLWLLLVLKNWWWKKNVAKPRLPLPAEAAPSRREKIAPCFLNFLLARLEPKQRVASVRNDFFPAQEKKRGIFTAVKYFKGARI